MKLARDVRSCSWARIVPVLLCWSLASMPVTLCSLFHRVELTRVGTGRYVQTWIALFPDSVYDADRNVTNSSVAILAQMMDDSGNELWAQPVQISTQQCPVMAWESEFGIAELGSDRFVVVWGCSFPRNRYVSQVFSTAGTRIGQETVVTEIFRTDQLGDVAEVPGVSSTGSGFVVVWKDWQPTSDRSAVFAQLFDSSGNKMAGVIEVASADFRNISLSADPVASVGSNGFVVVWSSTGSGGTGAFLQVFNMSGGKIGVERQLSLDTASLQASNFVASKYEVTVDPLGSDGFVVVFLQDVPGQLLGPEYGSTYAVFVQPCDSSGNSIGTTVRVDQDSRALENRKVYSTAVTASTQYPTSSTFAPALGTGLRATYYESEDDWQGLLQPLHSTSSDVVDFSSDGGDAPYSITPQDDTYSARWAGLIRAPATTNLTFGYTISAEDNMDRLQLWVDNKMLIDAWTSLFASSYDGGEQNSLSVTKGEVYNIQVAYKHEWGNFGPHSYQLQWTYVSDGSTTTGPIPRTHLFPFLGSDGDEFVSIDAGSGVGLSATYFDDTDFQSAVKASASEAVDFSAAVGEEPERHGLTPDGAYSVRWHGMIRAPEITTAITFGVTTGLDQDERVRIWIDNSLIIDQWSSMYNTASGSSPRTESPPIRFTPSQLYDIKIEYKAEQGLEAQFKLDWSYLHSGTYQTLPVPTTTLFPARPTDRIVVAWTEAGADPPAVMMARVLDATGSLVGPEFQVSTSTHPSVLSPALVSLGGDSIAAAWIPSPQTGSFILGWSGTAIASRVLHFPSPQLALALGPHVLPRPEHLHCGLKAVWADFFQCRKPGLCPYKTGGLGSLMRQDVAEVWVCVEHPCASLLNADPRFCFVYHEQDRRFVAWGPRDELDIQID